MPTGDFYLRVIFSVSEEEFGTGYLISTHTSLTSSWLSHLTHFKIFGKDSGYNSRHFSLKDKLRKIASLCIPCFRRRRRLVSHFSRSWSAEDYGKSALLPSSILRVKNAGCSKSFQDRYRPQKRRYINSLMNMRNHSNHFPVFSRSEPRKDGHYEMVLIYEEILLVSHERSWFLGEIPIAKE